MLTSFAASIIAGNRRTSHLARSMLHPLEKVRALPRSRAAGSKSKKTVRIFPEIIVTAPLGGLVGGHPRGGGMPPPKSLRGAETRTRNCRTANLYFMHYNSGRVHRTLRVTPSDGSKR